MPTHSFQVSEGQGGLNIVSLRKSYRKRLVIRDVSMHLNRGKLSPSWGQMVQVKQHVFTQSQDL